MYRSVHVHENRILQIHYSLFVKLSINSASAPVVNDVQQSIFTRPEIPPMKAKPSPLLTECGCSLLLSPQFEAYVKEGSTGVVVNLSVDDRDDPATGAGRALYSIINGDPTQSFEIYTNPDNNEGMLAVVKVKCQARRPTPHKHAWLR